MLNLTSLLRSKRRAKLLMYSCTTWPAGKRAPSFDFGYGKAGNSSARRTRQREGEMCSIKMTLSIGVFVRVEVKAQSSFGT